MNSEKPIFIVLTSIFGIETISLTEIDTTVKIICQVVVTLFTVYYLLTKTKQLKK